MTLSVHRGLVSRGQTFSQSKYKEKRSGHTRLIGGRVILITTGAKLLDTKYVFCGFNDDLIETIN